MDDMSMHQGCTGGLGVNAQNYFSECWVPISRENALIDTTGGVTSGSLACPHGGVVGEFRDRLSGTQPRVPHSRGEPASGSPAPTDQGAARQCESGRALAH